MKSFFEDLTSVMKSQSELYTKSRELAAIWIDKGIMTGEGKQSRICPDTFVWVKDGKFSEGEGEPTHKVLACRGTLINQFEFDLLDLKTNEQITIKLK